MIYVTGDLHGRSGVGKLSVVNFPEGASLTCEDYVVVLGDFGLPWLLTEDEKAALDWIEGMPWTTLFIDGNHENFRLLNGLAVEKWRGGKVHRIPGHEHIIHLMRGQVFDLDGSRVFTMGGATSTDRAMRAEGESWFPEELPSAEEYREADRNLARVDWHVDYVLTHTCPHRLASRVLYPDSGWQAPDADHLMLLLDRLEDRLSYRRWYFGHFHKDRNLVDKHTVLFDRFVKLGEGV